MSGDLTTRMRAAAKTLSEVASKFHPNDSYRWCKSEYSSVMLNSIADRWDREDAERSAEYAAIAQLAQDLATSAGYANPDALAKQRAADLYAMGYRKGGA